MKQVILTKNEEGLIIGVSEVVEIRTEEQLNALLDQAKTNLEKIEKQVQEKELELKKQARELEIENYFSKEHLEVAFNSLLVQAMLGKLKISPKQIELVKTHIESIRDYLMSDEDSILDPIKNFIKDKFKELYGEIPTELEEGE